MVLYSNSNFYNFLWISTFKGGEKMMNQSPLNPSNFQSFPKEKKVKDEKLKSAEALVEDY
jgi:hypothetical protein